MITGHHIRNPVEWSADQLRAAELALAQAGHHLRAPETARQAALPAVRQIGVGDLRDVLARGVEDFGAYRTDVIFICIIYPLAGLILARVAAGYDMLPLVFPLASGFALIGPLAAVGLYEMSRRREQGADITWLDAFGVVKAPAFGAIVVLGLVLLAIFLLWLAAAWAIYQVTLGPAPPASVGSFVREVFTTGAGWTLIIVGNAGGLPVRRAGADDQCGVVPTAARPRRRALYGGGDLNSCRGHEPGPDGRLGADRCGRPGARVAPSTPRPHLRHARAGARHLAPLSKGGDS